MELDGRIDGKDDGDELDGEASQIGKNMVPMTHSHSLLFRSMVVLLRFVCLWCLQLCTLLEYGHILTPDH